MRKLLLSFTTVLFYVAGAFAQHENHVCQALYLRLDSLSKNSHIEIIDIKKGIAIFKEIRKEKCLIDDYPVTSTIGELIIKWFSRRTKVFFI